jgi:hypothetical protein
LKIIYDIVGRPTLINDIHDTFSTQADFMIALNQMNLQGLRQKISVTIRRTSLLNQTVDEETWDLHL